MVYYTLCLGSANCQKSRWKIIIYVDEKPNFRIGTKGLNYIILNRHYWSPN